MSRCKTTKVDCAIIGAGPAGIAAAIQCTRQGLSSAVFESDKLGGQVRAANLIENLPGFPEGIRGPELVTRFQHQLDSHGIEIRRERVQNIAHERGWFNVRSARSELKATTVVVATGLVPKRLGIPGENALWGTHLFSYTNPDDVACAGSAVVVVGSGDAAFDQALNFARAGSNVTIVMKHAAPRCLPLLVDRVRDAGIDTISSCEVTSLEKDDRCVVINGTGTISLRADMIVTCIGKEPNLSFLDTSLLHGMVPGIFFAGDCHRGRNRHIAIACGDGIACAMDVARFIAEKNNETA